jgi:hypothetical protein
MTLGRFMPCSPLTSAVALPLDCFGCDWRCRHQRAHCVKDVSPAVLGEAIKQTLAGASDQPRLFLQPQKSRSQVAGFPRWQSPVAFVPVTMSQPVAAPEPPLQCHAGVHQDECGFPWLDVEAAIPPSLPNSRQRILAQNDLMLGGEPVFLHRREQGQGTSRPDAVSA